MKRRDFLRVAGAAAMATCLGGATAGAQRKPNVIIIYTDDQGSVDLNSYGAEDLVTPNMDRLAETGVRFTQFYAPSPVCSPSRAGMLTGRYPHRAGVPGNVGQHRTRPGLLPEQVTIAEMMRAGGYATAHIGKWHLGYFEGSVPLDQGFDYSFGHLGGCIDNYSHFFYWNGPNRHDLWKNGEEIHRPGEFFQDMMVEEATGFIEAHKDEPFFMYFAINSPHYPYQGDPKWLEYYREKGVAYPRDLYAAFLSTQDDRIGQLIDTVEALGLREDTIIVFQSDHGHSHEERAHFGGGSAGPYRGAKFSMFEGGIRIPAIISWPGTLPEGEVRNQIGHGCDWMPTIAELCDVPLVNEDIDGVSLAEVIRSESAPTPHGVIHWHKGNEWAVRDGGWKLMGNPRDTSEKAPLTDEDKLFLVNLDEDISEMTNLAAEHPEVVARLEKLHDAWFETVR